MPCRPGNGFTVAELPNPAPHAMSRLKMKVEDSFLAGHYADSIAMRNLRPNLLASTTQMVAAITQSGTPLQQRR